MMGDKSTQYDNVLSMLPGLLEGEGDLVANLSNTAALIKEYVDRFWIGFYLVKHDELVLGPFQGPVACTRIAKGKGVCGTAWNENRTVIVPDVHQFDGHIACNAYSRSEIVLPVSHDGEVTMVLDLDSDEIDHFDEVDAEKLEAIVHILVNHLYKS